MLGRCLPTFHRVTPIKLPIRRNNPVSLKQLNYSTSRGVASLAQTREDSCPTLSREDVYPNPELGHVDPLLVHFREEYRKLYENQQKLVHELMQAKRELDMLRNTGPLGSGRSQRTLLHSQVVLMAT